MKIWQIGFSLLIIGYSLVAQAGDARLISQWVREGQHLTIAEKIVHMSQLFLHKPYQNEPLGEGRSSQFNQEPLYRFDVFDCTTLVNTTLALAISSQPQDFAINMRRIVYFNGKVRFEQRTHFAMADWARHNEEQGILQDITQKIAGQKTLTTTTVYINKKQWIGHLPESRIKIIHLSLREIEYKLQQLHALSSHVKNTEMTIHYLPLTALLDKTLLARVPQGAIVLFIKNPDHIKVAIGTDIDVVHMGFMIQKNQVWYLRAASSAMRQVIDVPFLTYLQYNSDMKGVVFLQAVQGLRDPSPHSG